MTETRGKQFVFNRNSKPNRRIRSSSGRTRNLISKQRRGLDKRIIIEIIENKYAIMSNSFLEIVYENEKEFNF